MRVSDEELMQLSDAAIAVARNAYAPYSKFRVGAAVLGKTIHVGANVENASYGLSLCAERAALSAAVAAGEKNIKAVAIACIDGDPECDPNERMPCGACLQWIQELSPKATIILSHTDFRCKIRDLLPRPFRLDKDGSTGNQAQPEH